MPVKCKICGLILNKDSGVPYECPRCSNKGVFERISSDDFSVWEKLNKYKELVEFINYVSDIVIFQYFNDDELEALKRVRKCEGINKKDEEILNKLYVEYSIGVLKGYKS